MSPLFFLLCLSDYDFLLTLFTFSSQIFRPFDETHHSKLPQRDRNDRSESIFINSNLFLSAENIQSNAVN